jgi:hypothetical protein
MAASKASGTGRLMKAECPTCQFIAYLSRGAAIRHGLPVCACGSRLYCAKLDVQMEAVPELAHEHPEFKAYTEREIRSAQCASASSVLVPNRMRLRRLQRLGRLEQRAPFVRLPQRHSR